MAADAGDDPAEITKYVRAFYTLHGADYHKSRQMTSMAREFLLLSFCAETDLLPSETRILERTTKHAAFVSFHPRTPRDNLALAEQRIMRERIKTLEELLENATVEIHRLKSEKCSCSN